MKALLRRSSPVLALAMLALLAWAQPQDVPWPVDTAQPDWDYGFWFDKNTARWQTFAPAHPELRALAVYVDRMGDPGMVVVELQDPDGQALARVSGKPERGGWLYLPFEKAVRVTPGRLYRIYVYSDRVSPNPRQRFFWRGIRSSRFCPVCTTDVASGWPQFRYAFVVYASR
ncbi:hypothetical protein [Oceanithermus sp.]|uniref:hypothetical protein n=1 Tax=Oceanithermus sp. TaxID=2268145 RepID=UPI00257F5288|nr:hypothetical protein [Oceanithermus sp.]